MTWLSCVPNEDCRRLDDHHGRHRRHINTLFSTVTCKEIASTTPCRDMLPPDRRLFYGGRFNICDTHPLIKPQRVIDNDPKAVRLARRSVVDKKLEHSNRTQG